LQVRQARLDNQETQKHIAVISKPWRKPMVKSHHRPLPVELVYNTNVFKAEDLRIWRTITLTMQ
jgi:hypothetical protein